MWQHATAILLASYNEMSILLFEFQYSNFERVTQNKLEQCIDICFKLGSTQNQNAAFRFSIYKNKKNV